MDAAKYLAEKDRMCEFYHKMNRGSDSGCHGCPLEEAIQGITTSCCAFKEGMWNYEDYVKAVEKWSMENYIPTNREKFKEVYGFNPIMKIVPDDPWWERNYEKSDGAD